MWKYVGRWALFIFCPWLSTSQPLFLSRFFSPVSLVSTSVANALAIVISARLYKLRIHTFRLESIRTFLAGSGLRNECEDQILYVPWIRWIPEYNSSRSLWTNKNKYKHLTGWYGNASSYLCWYSGRGSWKFPIWETRYERERCTQNRGSSGERGVQEYLQHSTKGILRKRII